ncbi:MAG: acetolactate synthase isozyme1 large subunit [Rhodobacteraceae bacterium]|nr:acetolactate synthase isozyme1 large subunit [Paracoccaceae bacterium]
MLKARGVDVIFGIPGVHNQEMYRGIEEAGITHVLARHEQGAGFMADGYARATGKPGVAYVITGPGLTNIMTPMGQAYSDRVPMLVISSCLDETVARRGQLHQMKDQRAAAETVCAWSETALSVAAAYELIDRAFAEFAAGASRPRHITVPIHLLEAVAPPPPAPLTEPVVTHGAGGVRRVVTALKGARRPLFIFGGGARHAAEAAAKLLANTGAASMTTYAGRGVVTAETPLFLGAPLARPGSADVIAEADLVIAVGTELAEVDLWRHTLGHAAPLVRVDTDPEVLADAQRADLPILADANAFLETLAEEVTPQVSTWDGKALTETRARWRAEVDAERPGIVAVCDALRAATPDDAMIYSDMTQIAYVAKEVWDMGAPNMWHHPTGFGTLGYATPAGIGGAVARRGMGKTMVLIGDYGFHYTLPELGVAVELELPLPIVLWDNGKLKEIEESMVRGQIAPNAVVARNPDFVAVARAFGAGAVAPKSLSEIGPALTGAFAAKGPTLIYLTPEVVG